MAKPNPFLKKATGTSQKAPASLDKKRHGLGRGLDGLLGKAAAPSPIAAPVVPAVPTVAAGEQVLELKIADIERSPYQPRREFKPEELRELGESLKNNGLISPPTVRKNAQGRWELIAGERRLRAAQLIGWSKIRVTLVKADDLTAAAMTATENLQREDLNPIEEAMSYRMLIDRFNLTQADVAEKVGKGRATVANSTRLLELPDEVKQLVATRLLSTGHAKVLLSVPDDTQRTLLARDCVNSSLTVRALEKKVQRLNAPVPEKQPGIPDVPFAYARNLAEQLKRHLGCAVRLTPGMTQQNGRHTTGVLEIDLFNNDDLDRVIRMIGMKVD